MRKLLKKFKAFLKGDKKRLLVILMFPVLIILFGGVSSYVIYAEIVTKTTAETEYTVTTTEIIEIAFETEYIENSSLPDCIHLVSGDGVKGSREVTYEIRRDRETNKEIEKKATKETVLTEPVDIVEVQGTFQVRNNEDFKNTEYYKYMTNLYSYFSSNNVAAIFGELHPEVITAARLDKEQFIQSNSTEGFFKKGKTPSMPFDAGINEDSFSEAELQDILSKYLKVRFISNNGRPEIFFEAEDPCVSYSIDDKKFCFLNDHKYLVRTRDVGDVFQYREVDRQIKFLQRFFIDECGCSQDGIEYPVEMTEEGQDGNALCVVLSAKPLVRESSSAFLRNELVLLDGSSVNLEGFDFSKVETVDYILISYIESQPSGSTGATITEMKITDFKKYFEVDSLVKLMDLVN